MPATIFEAINPANPPGLGPAMSPAASRPAWAPLREEISLLPGPRARDGAPTWSLHDPARNLFFRIDWLSFEVLARWHLGVEGGAAAIVADLRACTSLDPAAAEVESVLQFLSANELVRRHTPQATGAMAQQARRRRVKLGAWLLHHYLFFRVPLWRPDAWLGRAARKRGGGGGCRTAAAAALPHGGGRRRHLSRHAL